MKYDTVEMISGRLYCPSTGEEIMSLDNLEPINNEAKALIAAWYSCVIEQPVFNNDKIKNAWEEYLQKFPEDSQFYDLYEKISEFLDEYEAPGWRVYEIMTSGLACGPVENTDWYVVLEDTVIEGNDLDEIDNLNI